MNKILRQSILPITLSQDIEMPVGSEILDIQSRGESISIWYKGDLTKEKEKRTFLAFETGTDISNLPLIYRKTVQLANGSYVLHFFEVDRTAPFISKGDYIKLVKWSDDVFDGNHPNCIQSGHTVYGTVLHDLEAGYSFALTDVTGDSHGWFHTSVVTEVTSEDTFRTMNSTYKIFKLPPKVTEKDIVLVDSEF